MSNFIKITDDNQELMHFGVMGMRWGKRRAPSAYSITKDSVKAAKKDRKDALDKSNASFQRDMKKLRDEGRSNDTDAVIKRSKEWDKEQVDINSAYYKKTDADIRKIKRHKVNVAKSAVSGILISKLASAAVYSLTGSQVVAAGVGAYAGIKTGRMMYDKLYDYSPTNEKL